MPYEPQKYEDKIYKLWEESGFFNPDNLPSKGKPFTIAMPPPNVTGILHLGHVLENALMDIEIRYQRLRGRKALLIPGTDHAAVATQARVEKDLIESGKYKNPRQELGREKLLKIIKDYAAESQSTILEQIRKIGTSCDWSRLAYTFDNQRSIAVNTIFKKMYADGLIYRGYRVINWSVKGQSTCSDDEIVYKERVGKLYYFKYAQDFPITIATTRPETKLGDTAVAVNPQDRRYKKYIGQIFTVDVGAINPLKIRIIADKAVDPKFGTGALGVTPAHSQADFDMYESRLGKSDQIEMIQVIGPDGKMTDKAGQDYKNLNAESAREKFVSWLNKNGLLEKEEEISQSVGRSDRFGDVIEVLPMEQWFVTVNKKIPGKNKTLKDLMKEAVTTGHKDQKDAKVNIWPENYKKIYLHWIDNLRDWCISRQIWWGHRIPVWYKDKEIFVGQEPPQTSGWKQDSDTLDTWFSSGLWTFSILGWPSSKKGSDFDRFHPTSWMQMGHEILFFWMARMIMMSTYALDQIPFKDVYIHGLLRDKQGRKFSKSLRNAIDPIDMIHKYGADSLRLSVIIGSAPGLDMRLYDEKISGYRNFVNKLWNISRFILTTVSKIQKIKTKPKPQTLADAWILSELDNLISQITQDLDNYRFSQAGERLYEFTWSRLADWYLEIAKIEGQKDQILLYILERLLVLWHPFTPFITEQIFSEFQPKAGQPMADNDGLLMVDKWPAAGKPDQKAIKNFQELQEIVSKIRNLKIENKIAPKDLPACVLTSKIFKQGDLEVIARLSRVKLAKDLKNFKSFKTANIAIKIDLHKEASPKEKADLEKYIKSLEARLQNPEFLKSAPTSVIEQTKEKLKKAKL